MVAARWYILFTLNFKIITDIFYVLFIFKIFDTNDHILDFSAFFLVSTNPVYDKYCEFSTYIGIDREKLNFNQAHG